MTAQQIEFPGDPKPKSEDALRARKRAIRAGELFAPPPDEFEAAVAAARAESERAAIELAAGQVGDELDEDVDTDPTSEELRELFGDADGEGEG